MKRFTLIFTTVLIVFQIITADVSWADVYNAIKMGKTEEVKSLVEKSPDLLNKVDGLGQTLLHHSIKNEKLDLVKFFVEKGADVNAKDKFGNTPLFLGAMSGNDDIMSFLIAKGADFKEKSGKGLTILHIASQFGFMKTARILVKKGISPGVADNEGNTPLHFAARRGELEAVKFLVEKGADVNAVNKKGLAPIHYASKPFSVFETWHGYETLLYLLSKGAKPNLRDEEGNTPLHYLAMHFVKETGKDKCTFEKEHAEAVMALIKHGADPGIPNNEIKKPLQIALDLDHREVAESLVKYGSVRAARNNLLLLIPLGIFIVIGVIYYRKRLEKKFEKPEN